MSIKRLVWVLMVVKRILANPGKTQQHGFINKSWAVALNHPQLFTSNKCNQNLFIMKTRILLSTIVMALLTIATTHKTYAQQCSRRYAQPYLNSYPRQSAFCYGPPVRYRAQRPIRRCAPVVRYYAPRQVACYSPRRPIRNYRYPAYRYNRNTHRHNYHRQYNQHGYHHHWRR